LTDLVPTTDRGGATVLKVGVSIASGASEKISVPTFFIPGGHETEYCTVFVIVIMTSKRLPAANAIT